MNREKKLSDEIELKESEIYMLKQKLSDLRYLDWKEMEDKYYLVETFPVHGKPSFYVYHIILIEKEKIIYKYGDIESKYTATYEYDNLISRGYKLWTEISKKKFKLKVKGFKDLDNDAKSKKVEPNGVII